MKKSYAINSFHGRCNSFQEEKVSIIMYNDMINLSNERRVFIFRCRHRYKFIIWY